MSTPVFADPESSTQANRAQSSRVSVPLPEDPYEAIMQAYLEGTDTEFEPFEDPESETDESSHIVAPPTCYVEESEDSGTFDARSISPSPTLPVWKRYKGTSELILGADSEEIDESSDSNSESEDVEDEGPTTEDEDPAAGDEGLAMGVEGPDVDDESY
nr:hypothetical protein [Tanacetum cinerariifolium]